MPLPSGAEESSDSDDESEEDDNESMDIDEVPNVLVKEKKAENKRIRRVRAAIEFPFGLLKNHWYKLSHAWLGKLQIQEDFIYLALALYNYQMN